MNNKIRQADFDTSEYLRVCQEQENLKKEKRVIEKELHSFKQELRTLNRDLDMLTIEIKRTPVEKVETDLVSLRDKYADFASDQTRVSSTRIMAAKFVEELNDLLKRLLLIPK